eukprot:scaffold230_cov138-Cylindrotheca_fusiformis.AAC.1
MERPNMDESSEVEDVQPEYFVYTSQTKEDDIPKQTLTHLRIDSSVTEIPDSAFEHCRALTHVLVASSVREISNRAFIFCRALTHVQLPETLKRIGKCAFTGCHQLKSVQFVSRNASLEIPSINENFEDGTIVFPETMVLELDYHAFSCCHSLRKIVVCSVSTKLGKGVFQHCQGLISACLPEGLQVINPVLFADCSSLTTVNIPSSVTKIDEEVFSGCESLSSCELPDGLLQIGKSSFVLCQSIEALHVPSTVSSIQDGAFTACTGLKHIKLPPTLKSIEPEILSACESLEYVEIPSTVEDIGHGAFSGCLSLSHIRIPNSFKRFTPASTPRPDAFQFHAGEGRYSYFICDSLISMELPEGILVELDPYYCPSLVNVVGPVRWLHQEMESTADFLQHSMLGSVVDDEADLTRKLEHRFDDAPLNKLCYYHSYQSSEDAMTQLRSLTEDDPLAATTQMDEFGMTPLHVLSLSQTPNLEMVLAVMAAGKPGHMVHCRDSFGYTPMDYLCLNRMPNTSEVIRTLFRTHYDQVLGLDRSWKSDMLQQVDEGLTSITADRSSRRREIVGVVRKYERKEVLSLVELCLWKEKIDEVSSKKELILADRQRCRIMSGAAIVIPLVLPFLDTLDVEDFFVGSE